MKRLGLMMVLAMSVLTVEALAQPPKAGKPGAGQRGPRAAQQGQNRQGARDPQKMATMMLERFDKDGDQKLDSAELVAALTAMRQRGDQAAAGRRGQGPGGAGQGNLRKRPGGQQGKPGQQRKRGNGNAGGEKPKRPQDDSV